MLLAFYQFPAEYWRHLRTTNSIESMFAPVRARTDVTKGPGSRAAGVAMIFNSMEAAEGRWRRINGSHLVPLVRAKAKFLNGEFVERARRRTLCDQEVQSITFDNVPGSRRSHPPLP